MTIKDKIPSKLYRVVLVWKKTITFPLIQAVCKEDAENKANDFMQNDPTLLAEELPATWETIEVNLNKPIKE